MLLCGAQDPHETTDLAESQPALLQRLLKRWAEVEATVYDPDRGVPDPRACEVAIERWGGFFGPYMDLPNGSWAV